MNEAIWQKCLGQLENEVNGDQFETYLRPLQADFSKGGLTLLARTFMSRKVRSTFLARINEYFEHNSEKGDVLLSVGGMKEAKPLRASAKRPTDLSYGQVDAKRLVSGEASSRPTHNLNREFTLHHLLKVNPMNSRRRLPFKLLTTRARATTHYSCMAVWAWVRPILCKRLATRYCTENLTLE